MLTTNEKGRDSCQSATQTTSHDHTALVGAIATPCALGKSTSGEAQRERILRALSLRPHTSYELRKLGCYQCPTRIIELRRMGFNIGTERVTVWDDEGYRHSGVALYTLIPGA